MTCGVGGDCHRQFDEATAILAGDALQALAFEVLLGDGTAVFPAATRIAMARTLAVASGSSGMAGGQALDLAAVGQRLNLAALENVHVHKTGALIRASVMLAYHASGRDDAALAARLERYATCIGLAFQVQDDILDVEGETAVIGDHKARTPSQPTYPAARPRRCQGHRPSAVRRSRCLPRPTRRARRRAHRDLPSGDR